MRGRSWLLGRRLASDWPDVEEKGSCKEKVYTCTNKQEDEFGIAYPGVRMIGISQVSKQAIEEDCQH